MDRARLTASRCVRACFSTGSKLADENARRSGDEIRTRTGSLNRWPWRVESFKRAEWSMFRGPSESRSHGRPNCIQTLPIKLARSLENLQSAARSLAFSRLFARSYRPISLPRKTKSGFSLGSENFCPACVRFCEKVHHCDRWRKSACD